MNLASGRVSPASVPATLRYLSISIGVLLLAVGTGMGLNMSWATAAWPWPDGKLSYLFVGSILAAVSVAIIWIGWSGEWGALPAGAVTALVMTSGMSIYLFQLSSRPGGPNLLPYALSFAFVALSSLGFFFWSRRFAIRDVRPMPVLLRVSYAIFVIVLVLAATALILRVPTIFPWPLNPDSSVMFGWIFIGDACYFLYSLLNPRWHNARAQLLSFLAYDLVLIVPFLGLFATIGQDRMPSLLLYMAVLIYSGLLAIYYLFIDPQTRGWEVQEAREPGAEGAGGVH